MNLQLLQTNIAELIKSRNSPLQENDEYLSTIRSSEHLLLIKKIAFWWRKIQIEQYSVLTANLLKANGNFDVQVSNFISKSTFSAFRDEVGLQFLNYIIFKHIDSLTQSVAEFELAIIKLKLGENIESLVAWKYEPYSVIKALLRNTLNIEKLNKGNYTVAISFMNKEELFTVRNNDSFIA